MYQRQVSFTEAVSMAFQKYCQFSGRASRSEFWWFALFTTIVGIVIEIPFNTFAAGNTFLYYGISGAVNLVFLLPQLGLTIRRLHDIGKGGGWIFINCIPLVGQIIFLIWMAKDSEPVDNRFGPIPNLVA